jgi:moderate conductance mechanosensitive channel
MRLVLALLLLLALPSQVPFAAEANAPPPGMTQQQFDALVDAISQAVVTKLRKQGAVVAAKPEAAARVAASEPEEDLESRVAIFEARAGQVLTSYPALVRELARIPAALDESGSGGRGLWRFLLMLVIASCATIGAEIMVRRALDGVRRRMEGRLAAHEGWRAILPLTGLMATDAIALAAVGLVGYGLLGAWFAVSDNQGKLAGAVLRGIFAWRLYMLAFRIVLRPDLKGARLAAMDDVGAVAVYDRFSTIVLVGVLLRTVLLPILLALQSPSEAIAAGQILGNVVVIGLFVWGAWASREPMASWLADLARVDGRRSMGEFLGRHWLVVALPFFLLLLIAQIYGAIEMRSTIPTAMVLTLNAVIGLIFLKTLIAYLTRLHRHRAFSATEPEAPATSTMAEPHASDVIARCVFVAAMLGAIALVAETWIVDVLALVNADGWRALTRASLTAACTLFAAYVAWEFVKFATFRYGARPPPAPGAAPAESDQRGAGSASRLATLMPLMRIVLAITIFVIAGLIVLSELGVNITPLIAAASVFGLAISFGSQTLVRDIVSGVFYLADDAFRVGDYIDCGKAKGTVEGFTLRSIRLRHQSGQVHTIPFGQLGQITNFSRDWTGVKFNLRLARNTDLEMLRKTVKKIGQQMLEDPEMKDEILEPLKMQGIADIADNAIIARFKFTVRPGKPTQVQHEAIRRMMAAFGPAGIEFA